MVKAESSFFTTIPQPVHKPSGTVAAPSLIAGTH